VIVADAMQVDVTVRNRTSKTARMRDFSFINSLLKSSTPDVSTAKMVPIAPGNALELTIIPIAGKKRDSFVIDVKGESIIVWWNFVLNKGYGPFLEQDTKKYRATKRIEEGGSVVFDVVEKNSLQSSESLAKDLLSQHFDTQDISDQTGFTEKELQSKLHLRVPDY
jgi:hypothetical protein